MDQNVSQSEARPGSGRREGEAPRARDVPAGWSPGTSWRSLLRTLPWAVAAGAVGRGGAPAARPEWPAVRQGRAWPRLPRAPLSSVCVHGKNSRRRLGAPLRLLPPHATALPGRRPGALASPPRHLPILPDTSPSSPTPPQPEAPAGLPASAQTQPGPRPTLHRPARLSPALTCPSAPLRTPYVARL